MIFIVDEVESESPPSGRGGDMDTVTSVDSGVGMPCMMGRKRRGRMDSQRLTVSEEDSEQNEMRLKQRLSRASR